MKKITVYIERGTDGSYGAYMPENPLPFGAIGDGKTASEAKADFLAVVESYKADGYVVPADTVFDFKYDMASFLEYYKRKFTLAGLEEITGVSQGQLSHYLNGTSKPTKRTIEKIQNGIHSFSKELSQVDFV